MQRRLVLLGVLACWLALSAGCVVLQPKPDGTWSVSLFPPSSPTTVTGGSTGGTVSQKAQAKGSSVRVGRPGEPVSAGTAQTSGPWQVLVDTEPSPAHLTDGSKPASGTRFLVVDVTIKNVPGGTELTVLPSQFVLKNPKNQVIEPFHTKPGFYNAQGMKPIGAGEGGSTSFVYEVPTNNSLYTFEVTPKQGATGTMSWHVE